MSIYDPLDGLAEGIKSAVNLALAFSTLPRVLVPLADGTDKVVLIHYFGDADGRSCDPIRKDGLLTIVRPGDAGYAVHDDSLHWDDEPANIRAGVPLWLIRPQGSTWVTIGVGKLHPRWSAATIDFYDPTTRLSVVRTFFADPRMAVIPEQYPSLQEQKEQIAAAGGALRRMERRAPCFPHYQLDPELLDAP